MQIRKLIIFHNNNFTIPKEDALPVIDEILWLLKDGKWHNLEKIIEKCPLSKSEVKMVVSFLWEYEFIQVDDGGRKAKLYPLMFNFIDEIQRIEREEALSH